MRSDDYIHLDVSYDFSPSAKALITTLVVAIFGLLTELGIRGNTSASRLVAMVGAWLMVLVRSLFSMNKMGPEFSLVRCVLVEPLVLLWGSMLLTALLQSTTKEKKQGFFQTFLCSSLWIHQGQTKENSSDWTYLASFLGSMLTMSGSVAGIAVALKAYDEIRWYDFSRDMVLPAFCTLVLGSLAFALRHCLGQRGQEASSYSAISLQDCSTQADDTTEDCLDAVAVVLDSESPVEITDMQSHAGPSNPDIRVKLFLQALPFFAMTALYFYDFNLILVLTSFCAVVFLFKLGRSFVCNDNVTCEDLYGLVTGLDYGNLLWHLCLNVIISGWTDTGHPQQVVNWSLGRCADRFVEPGRCTFETTALFAMISVLFSPISAVIWFGDTFPYGSPYAWMQGALAVSIGGSLCVLGNSRQCFWVTESPRWKWLLVQAVVCTIVLCAGSLVLERFHWSYECSVRLGECMMPLH